jgi:hypothetical protein
VKLGELSATVTYVNTGCVFMPTIIVNQVRDDTGDDLPKSFDVDVDYDESRYDAIHAATRRTRGRVVWQGADLILTRVGDVTFSFSVKTGEYWTLDFATRGAIWSMPSTDEVPTAYDPCAPPPTPIAAHRTPQAWGNKLVEFYLGLASGYVIEEFKLFRGRTFQKSNSKDTGIDASFSCVDESLLIAKKPLCLQIPPNAGYYRGEIVRLAAANVGFDPDDVICPLGGLVTKPILLSNASLLPFIEEFGLTENWWAHVDEEGKLVVAALELKDEPDFTLDASNGDYIYDSITEALPSQPPTNYYVTSNITAKPGEDEEVTTITTEEIEEFYAPESVKVRPSGVTTYLFSDGTYRAIPTEILQVVSRTITRTTKRHGVQIKNQVERWQFYNPLAKDPNFDSLPAGTAYDGAYSNKTFHRDEVESLMKFSESITENKIDSEGTLQGQVMTEIGWFAPKHAIEFFYPTVHRDPVSREGIAYMYPGPSFRTLKTEVYGVKEKVTRDYVYGDDGTLSETLVTTEKYFSPTSRCDPILEDVPGVPDPPPRRQPWQARVTGPLSRSGQTFFFAVDFSDAGVDAGTYGVDTSNSGLAGSSGSLQRIFNSSIPHDILFGPTRPRATSFSVKVTATTKPTGTGLARLVLTGTIVTPSSDAGTAFANILFFDPWAGLPAGADLRFS